MEWWRFFPVGEVKLSLLVHGDDDSSMPNFPFDNTELMYNGRVFLKAYRKGLFGWRHTIAKSPVFRLFKGLLLSFFEYNWISRGSTACFFASPVFCCNER
jgi:hypothetical protein